MELGGLDYVAVFATTLALTLGLTPLALRFALRRRILDHPSEIKSQSSPVPYLGGVAIVLSFATVVLVAAAIRPPVSGTTELWAIMGTAVVLAIMGLVDDLRGLSPWLRLAIEIGAGVVVWLSPAGAELFTSAPIDLAVTVLWVVGVTNALNLLDNMDGLSAGVAAISATSIFVLAAENGQFLVATLAIGVVGCAGGFLRSNFHPARIYMGDAGALFLGFLLAVLGLKLEFPDLPRDVAFSIPVLLCGVALFDTVLVTVNRVLHHRSPLSGGRDHTSHRLVFVGVPIRAAVSLIYLACGSLGALAVVQARSDRVAGWVIIGLVLAIAATCGTLLSLVPVYETSRRRHLMFQEVRRRETEPTSGFGAGAGDAASA